MAPNLAATRGVKGREDLSTLGPPCVAFRHRVPSGGCRPASVCACAREREDGHLGAGGVGACDMAGSLARRCDASRNLCGVTVNPALGRDGDTGTGSGPVCDAVGGGRMSLHYGWRHHVADWGRRCRSCSRRRRVVHDRTLLCQRGGARCLNVCAPRGIRTSDVGRERDARPRGGGRPSSRDSPRETALGLRHGCRPQETLRECHQDQRDHRPRRQR